MKCTVTTIAALLIAVATAAPGRGPWGGPNRAHSKAATTASASTSNEAIGTTSASTVIEAAITADASTATEAATTTSADTATQICAQYGTTTSGAYLFNQDIWGESTGTGSQCSEVTSYNGNSIGWETTWSWANTASEGSQVRSYANVETSVEHVQLSAIESMQSTWEWAYSGNDVVADVSYDAFTSATEGGTQEYEIMIWLGALGGVTPIGGDTVVASPTIGGHVFNLYKGENTDTHTMVFSYVAQSQIQNFSGDVMGFFNYLIQNQGLSSSQYIISIGAGTEAFT